MGFHTACGISRLHCDTLPLHDNEEAITDIALQGWLNVETEQHEGGLSNLTHVQHFNAYYTSNLPVLCQCSLQA